MDLDEGEDMFDKLYFLMIMLASVFGAIEVQAHEGHVHHLSEVTEGEVPVPVVENAFAVPDPLTTWLNRIGRLHLLILHFPVALIVMTVLAELLWVIYANRIFDHAARFMIVAAAVSAPITALFGFALSYGQSYVGLSLDLFEWHRYFGIITAGLVVVTAILRELYVRDRIPSLTSYYICLFFLFVCINLTGTFGGVLAFGIDAW